MIKVKDSQGNIFTSDMSSREKHTILEVHFFTSYTSVKVQMLDQKNDKGGSLTKWIYITPDNGEMDIMDTFAFDGTEEWGDFIND